jgi:hypothetical protein
VIVVVQLVQLLVMFCGWPRARAGVVIVVVVLIGWVSEWSVVCVYVCGVGCIKFWWTTFEVPKYGPLIKDVLL